MPVIDFIRHGEPDISVHDDRLRPLTSLGKSQAQNLVQVLQNNYTAIFASPLLRAVSTIEPLAEACNLNVQTSELLVERKMPAWFKDSAEYADYLERQWHDFTFAAKDAESLASAQARYIKFMQSLDEADFVAVGSHGTAMSTVYEMVHPGSGFAFWRKLPYAAVMRVQVQSGVVVRAELLDQQLSKNC